jgi:tRNA A37 threonylcarbamoyladenosine modification protein TsaB
LTGPGLERWGSQVPAGVSVVAPALWEPQPTSLLRLGLARLRAGEHDDVWQAEPLYLRPSAAEEQWQARRIP